MKTNLLASAIVLSAIYTSAYAGTDSAPMSSSSTDTKDMKQMSTNTSSDAGFYVAVLGGAQFDTDYGDHHQTLGAASTHTGIGSTWAGVGGFKVGYNFESHPMGNFMGLRLQPAVEAEGLYIGDTSYSSGGFPGTTHERLTTNSGDFFLNGILRFKNRTIVTPYIGVGAGLQYITTHGYIDTAGAAPITGLDGSDLDFAGQALFGVDVAIAKHLSLFSEYKFIDAIGTDAKAGSSLGSTYRFKPDQIQQDLITAGIKYTF